MHGRSFVVTLALLASGCASGPSLEDAPIFDRSIALAVRAPAALDPPAQPGTPPRPELFVQVELRALDLADDVFLRDIGLVPGPPSDGPEARVVEPFQVRAIIERDSWVQRRGGGPPVVAIRGGETAEVLLREGLALSLRPRVSLDRRAIWCALGPPFATAFTLPDEGTVLVRAGDWRTGLRALLSARVIVLRDEGEGR